MICRNCGALIQKEDAVCPYCGAMNAAGAERKFMGRLYGMKEELHRSAEQPSAEMKKTVSRSFGIMAICMLIIVMIVTAGNLVKWKWEDWQERRYEKQQYEKILWKDSHYEQMDRLYEKGDLQGILDYLAEEDTGIYMVGDWEHSTVLESYQTCSSLRSAREQWKENGSRYPMKSAFADAFTMAVYERESRRSRIKTERDAVLFEEHVSEAMCFLTEDFGMTEEDIKEVQTELEQAGYASYSILTDYAESRLEGGTE